MIKAFLDHLVESEEGAFIPPNSMATPETMSPVPSTIERLPTDYDNGEKKVIVAGKKKLRQKSFKENLDYNRDVLISRVVPALMIGTELYTTERGKSHADIKHPNRGQYVWGYHDPVSKKFYHWGDLKVDATELRPEGGYRMNPRLWRTMTEGYYNNESLNYHDLLPALKYKNKIYVGKHGDGHYDILDRHDLPVEILNWGQNVGYHNIKTKKFIPKYNAKTEKEFNLDASELMTPLQRIRKFGTEETINEAPVYHVTLTKNVPTIRKKGILPFGGPTHKSNWQRAGDKSRYGQGEIYGFEHETDANKWAANWDWKLNKEIGSGKVSVVKLDSPDTWEEDTHDQGSQAGKKGRWLKIMKRQKPETITDIQPFDQESSKKLAAQLKEGYDPATYILRSRVIPAGRDQWGKVHLGERGQTHGFILAGLMKKGFTKQKGYKGLEYGYHDPLTKKFYNRTDLGFDATELPEFKRRWEETIQEELQDYERQILKSRAIPALKHPVTGKIHLGKRGQDHIDLADSVFANDKEGLKHYTELEHSGYIDSASKKFYSRREAGFDSSEIMTGMQRMRKYNTEETSFAIKSRLVPALKHHMDKKLLIGKRGQTHQDIYEKHFSGKLWQNSNYMAGFFDPKHKKFMSAFEGGVDSEDLADMDSTDLMTPIQRMRKFGTEEFKTFGQFLNESKWGQYVYHATYKPNFKPYAGMHVGTLHAAMSRAHQVSNDAGGNDFGHPLQVHAFRYNTKGKSAAIIDHTDESGSPTEMITHEPRDVAGYLNRKKVANITGKTHKEIGSALKGKGITHLSYRNTYEDPGSTSHMIYDPESLEHVHSFTAPKFTRRYKKTDKPYFDKTAKARKINKEQEEGFGTFGEYLNESPTAKFRPEYSPILHNPSYSALLRQHTFAAGGAALDNPFSKKHELRYLASRDGKHVWTVDAAEMIHDEMANKVGINTKMDSNNQAAYWTHHHYLGNIRSHHLTVIKKHPKGLVGWIQDRHRNSPGPYAVADYSREKE